MFKPGDLDRMGYSIDLPNGLTVSVQWHQMAYADVVDGEVLSVEIACYMTDRNIWMTHSVWTGMPHLPAGDIDDVIGWVPIADVQKYSDIARLYTQETET